MKVPLSWLREFVDVPGSAADIGTTMSVRGFAVEGIEEGDGDAVIDFEVTGNRPDCMSIVGMAREIATAYELPLRSDTGPATESGESAPVNAATSSTAEPPPIAITIDDPDLCRCYVGAVADVTVGPSPAWLQARLKACGIRPISNIVDITNYVLLEMGQPMHAFDRAKLGGGQIRVRQAKAGERLTTLDGQERTLSAGMLVIADASVPVAVAGVMGGADSEVSDATRSIVFESAYFNPQSVRRTSRALGLKTEASMRFERGIDPGLAAAALQRACALLEQIGAGRAGSPIVAGTTTARGRTLLLRRARIAGILGVAVPDEDVVRILTSLGFQPLEIPEGWFVAVPARRVDVTREVDLVEEVARHYGYDRIPSTFPALRSAPPPSDPQLARARRVRHVMTGLGFSEAVTFGFTSARAARQFAADDDSLVRIKNPLSEAFAVLRPSLLPGLVESAATNARRGRPDVRLFEGGTRFVTKDGAQQSIAFVWTGNAAGTHWSERPRPVDFFDARAVAEALARAHDAAADFIRLDPPPPFLVAGRAAALVPRGVAAQGNAASEAPAGFVGELTADVAETFGMPAGVPVYIGELDWEALARFERRTLTVTPVPRFPTVVRDISILVDERIEAAAVRSTITDSAGPILEDVREFDRYKGKGIPEDQVSLSLRLTFRSPERTLTDAEVQRAMDGVLSALRERHAATQR